MTTKFASHTTCLDVKDHDSPIHLGVAVSAEIWRRDVLKRTRPEARKSPLRLNLRHVACPDPNHRQSARVQESKEDGCTELARKGFRVILSKDEGISQGKIHSSVEVTIFETKKKVLCE